MTQTRAITLNALSLYAAALVLAATYAAQFILHELPCPLCLLQRILFAALAVGLILNIRFGPRPSHYAMSLLVAVAGAVASTRLVLLHIMPATPAMVRHCSAITIIPGRCSASLPPSSCLPRSCCSTANSKRTRPCCRPPAAPSHKSRCGW